MPRKTLQQFRAGLPAERLARYRELIQERLGFDVQQHPARRIDSTEVAALAGVQPGTVTQWVMRTRRHETSYPWLAPDPASFPGKSLYDPIDVCAWQEWARKDLGNAGRPDTRGPRVEVPAA